MMFVVRKGLLYWAGQPAMLWTWAPALAMQFSSIAAAEPVGEGLTVEPLPHGVK